MFVQPKGQVKGLASQRHQLTSLLNTAYSQREELEERIAANKKGMRAAGTKYGKWDLPKAYSNVSLKRTSRILTYSLIPTQQCMHYFCTIHILCLIQWAIVVKIFVYTTTVLIPFPTPIQLAP